MAGQRSHTIGIGITLLVLVGVLIANYGTVQRHHQERAMNRTLYTEDIPPSLALITFAVGPMRGLIADMLWWRAVQMQDQGDFFEAVQLAEWITKLQPTYATVWAYHGWNMSSNIVNSVRTPEERWKWVLQGIELLRDEGLRYNPGNEDIRNELANIFQFRIGGLLDPYNDYYKRQWILHMMRFLQQGDREELEALIDAPRNRAELLAIPGVPELLEAAGQAGVNLLTFEGFYNQRRWSPQARQAILREQFQSPLYTIRLYHSRRGVIEELGMDPERMWIIDNNYGPLDWRLWQAQTIYWAAPDGLPGYADEYGASKFSNTFIQQAMLSSFRGGKLVFLRGDTLLVANNLEIMGNVDRFLHTVKDNYTANGEPVPAGVSSLFATFHETAAVMAYIYMEEALARDMYRAYRDEFMDETERRGSTFDSFIAKRAEKVLQEGGRDTPGLIQSAMYQAYTWLALGDDWKAHAYERLARFLHQRHQTRYADQPDKELPSMDYFQKGALQMALDPQRTSLPEPVRQRLGQLFMDRGSEGTIPIEAAGTKPQFNMPEGLHEGDDH